MTNKNIEKMRPFVLELVNSLKPYGITFSETDGHLDNVVFESEDKTVKIAHSCFYRFSGLCKIPKFQKEVKSKDGKLKGAAVIFVDVDDHEFITSYMGDAIRKQFGI